MTIVGTACTLQTPNVSISTKRLMLTVAAMSGCYCLVFVQTHPLKPKAVYLDDQLVSLYVLVSVKITASHYVSRMNLYVKRI